MSQCIIYPKDDGGVSILYPISEQEISLEELANKRVPEGKPYKIINIQDIPEDRTFRNAWEYVP